MEEEARFCESGRHKRNQVYAPMKWLLLCPTGLAMSGCATNPTSPAVGTWQVRGNAATVIH